MPPRRGNLFSRIAIDQTVEETVNMDMQIAGGQRVSASGPWQCRAVTAGHCAVAMRPLRVTMLVKNPTYFMHVCFGVQTNRRTNKESKQLLSC